MVGRPLFTSSVDSVARGARLELRCLLCVCVVATVAFPKFPQRGTPWMNVLAGQTLGTAPQPKEGTLEQ